MLAFSTTAPVAQNAPPARLALTLLLLVSLLPVFMVNRSLEAALPAAHTMPATAERLTAPEWDTVRTMIREAQYQPAAVTVDGGAAFQARNQAHGLELVFLPGGLRVTPAVDQPAWQMTMGLAGYGYAGAVQPLAHAPRLDAAGERVTYRWPQVSEWYVNDEHGLKHNLTLLAPPSGSPARWLQFDLAIGGDLAPTPAADQRTVALRDGRGSEVLQLGALYVYDAQGKTLAAHYGRPVGGRLPMLVDARHATYPITVDPLLTARSARLTATTPGLDVQFGYSVAVNNDLLAVGAYRESSGGLTNNGAVYLFARNAGGADGWNLIRRVVPAAPVDGGQFGAGVAISGDMIVVGAPGETIQTGAAYIFARNQGGVNNWGQVQRIAAADGAPADQFGASVAIDGDTAAIGAASDDDAGNESGAVYLFVRNRGGANAWGQVAKVVAADAAASDRFGWSVALDHGLLAVGAPGESSAPTSANGVVYLFARNVGGADAWGQLQKVFPGDPANDDFFGTSVALHDETLAVGAPGKDEAGVDSGAAYVFVRNAGGADAWGQVRKLVAPDGVAAHAMGTSVAINGDAVLAGAPGANGGDGAVYLFLRNQGGLADSWAFNSRLEVNDASDGAFGSAVAIDGLFIAVGAPAASVGGQSSAGAAYSFVRGGEAWSELVRRQDNEAGEQDNTGFVVALSGDLLAVSASGDDLNPNDTANRGAVYLFRRNQDAADGWNFVRKIVHPTPVAGDDFGYSIALDGETLAVGARRDDIAGPVSNAGSVFVFRRNQGGVDTWGLVQTLNAPAPVAADLFGYAVTLDGDTLVVGAPGQDTGGNARGRGYIYLRNQGGADNWGLVAEIAPGDPQDLDQFGMALAIDGDTIIAGVPMRNSPGPITDAGAAYLFARNQGGADNWGQVVKLTAPLAEQQANDYFGSSVALDGDTVAIGAQGENASGAVYLFRRNQGGADNWGQLIKLAGTPGPGVAVDDFGASVALDNDILVVGASNSTTAAGVGAGTAYLFYRNQGGADAWGQAQELSGSDPAANDQFGLSVDTAAGLVAVGAPYGAIPPTPFNNSGTDLAGGAISREAAYVFNLNDTSTPTVTNVTSSTADGTYRAGDTITIQVLFSEPVFVIGVPTLILETGAIDATASYSSGSGTDTLTFVYTVGAGEESPDLDYTGSSALALNGGLIRDLAGNDALLTLPAPGGPGSLSANKNLVIAIAVAPVITAVSATTPDGIYGIGATITIVVNFSEPVTVSGMPSLTLETGAGDATAGYSAGSGSAVLSFTYTVAESEETSDLDYVSTTALSLNGGTINSLASGPADLTLPAPGTPGSLGTNKNLVIDGIRPTVTIEAVTPDPRDTPVATIAFTFSEAVTSLTIDDLALSRDGTPLDLSTASLSGGPAVYSLGNLAALTAPAGAYLFTIADATDIADSAGNTLTTAASESWNLAPAGTAIVTVTSAPNPSVFGQSIILTATLSAVSGTPTGTVQFFNGSTSLGSRTLNNGQAVLVVADLPIGINPIRAEYSGDAVFDPASGVLPGGQVVNKADTGTSLTSTPNPSLVGQSVVLAASVTAVAPGAGTPGGTVEFRSGTTVLGSAPVTGGSATLTVTTLPVGVNVLTARYSGDDNFNSSSSAAINHTVNAGQQQRLYVPMVFVDSTVTTLLPDLVVREIRSRNGLLEVVIANQGDGPVVDPFWVDLYINPNVVPTGPNETWNQVGNRGLVWGIEGLGLQINPGDTLVLRVDDAFYRPELSNTGGPIDSGSELYVQVDSADLTRATGGILERDELPGGVYNNVTRSLAESTIPLPALLIVERPDSAADLPRRR